MRILLIVIGLFGLVGCTKEGREEQPIECRPIKSISTTYDSRLGQIADSIHFFYDDEERLIRAEVSQFKLKYVYEYDGMNLIEIKGYNQSTNRLERKEEVTNRGGKPVKYVEYVKNQKDSFVLSGMDKLVYDTLGQILEYISYSSDTSFQSLRSTYIWENGNVVNEKFRIRNSLAYEFNYGHDTRPNCMRGNLYYLRAPMYWSMNTVDYDKAIDYIGNFDRSCNPCSILIEYNSSGLPFRLTSLQSATESIIEYY